MNTRTKRPPVSNGDRFGRITILGERGVSGQQIHGRCDCGAEKLFSVSNLRQGSTKSCGCLVSDLATARYEAVRKRSGLNLEVPPNVSAWSTREPLAYLAGVVCGDGWVGQSGALCLRVADLDFAVSFSRAIQVAFDLPGRVTVDERGYYLIRQYGKGRFTHLRTLEPATDAEMSAWLCGWFDSEGNAQLRRKSTRGPRSFDRRISFYSTNESTVDRGDSYLDRLGIMTRWCYMKPSAGHIGSKPVVELALTGGQENYRLFAEQVGSSIGRKQNILLAIPDSYTEINSEHYREMGRRSAAARLARLNAGGER